MKALSTLFKPRLSHPDPEVRSRAIAALPTDDERMIQAALSDPEPLVRKTALFGIADLGVLQGCATHDDDALVREHACDQLLKRLCSPSRYNYTQQDRLNAVAIISDTSLLAGIAVEADDAKIRLLAVEKLEEPQLLLKVACDDSNAEVRAAAAFKIHDQNDLKRIQHAAKHHDNRVYKLVSERLSNIRNRRRREEKRQELTEQIEQLAQSAANHTSAAKIERYLKEWHESGLLQDADKTTIDRVETARSLFKSHYQSYRDLISDRELLVETLLALGKQIDSSSAEQLAALADDVSAISEQYQSFPNVDDTTIRRLNRQFSDNLKRLELGLSEAQRDLQRTSEIRVLWRDLEALHDQINVPPPQIVDALVQKVKQISYPNRSVDGLNAAEMRERTHALSSRLQSRLGEQRRINAGDNARAAIAALAAQIQAGKLSDALSLRDLANKAVRNTHDLNSDERKNYNAKLEKQEIALRELQDWHRWGADQSREALCQEAEILNDSPDDNNQRAKTVQTLRKRWQTIDSKLGRVNKVLWERFDNACSAAYEPVIDARDQRKLEEADNEISRAAFCEKINQLERDTDWADVDWRKMAPQVRSLRGEWRKLGGIKPSAWKTLNKRFEDAIKSMESRLREINKRSKADKETLIERVAVMAKSPENQQSIERTIAAQQEWKDILPLPRHEDQKLWNQFRKACDAVFARRDAERKAANDQAKSDQEALDKQLQALRDLCPSSPEAPFNASTWDQLSSDIRQASRKLPAKLANKYSGALAKLDKQRKKWQADAEQHKQQKRDQALDDAETLCRAAEAQLQQNAVIVEFEKFEIQWKELAVFNSAIKKMLGQRFQRIAKAVENEQSLQDWLAELDDAAEERNRILLDMEIIAGQQSPDDWHAARQQRQVTLLSELITAPDSERQQRLQALNKQYRTTPAVKQELWPKFDQRYCQLLSHLGRF